jgi:sporulation integral membrane protein YlbJ
MKKSVALKRFSLSPKEKTQRKRTFSKKNLYLVGLYVACLFYAFALIVYPARYLLTTRNAFALWATSVLPSLFPFMVLCSLLFATGALKGAAKPLERLTTFFRLPSVAGVCFLIGITSGYPVGSRTISQLYDGGCIDQYGVKKLSVLCTTTGPLFCLSSVGVGMLGSAEVGAKIYLAHIVCCLVSGLIFSMCGKRVKNTPFPPHKQKNVLYECFYGATIAVLVAAGFIAFFATAAQMMADFQLFAPLEWVLSPLFGEDVANALCIGLVEMTTGCALLAKTGSRFAVPLIGFLITFGGGSILLQQLCYLLPSGVNALRFTAIKLGQALLCFCLLLLLP